MVVFIDLKSSFMNIFELINKVFKKSALSNFCRILFRNKLDGHENTLNHGIHGKKYPLRLRVRSNFHL